MKIVVTEAASTLAYHLVQLVASGDVIQDQTIELILCDNTDRQDVVNGVAFELQDCVYPALSGVTTTSDLCESFKNADIALMLPKPQNDNVPKDIRVDYTELKQIDFHVLDGAFHPAGITTQDSCKFRSRGAMSTALSIANSLQQYHLMSLKMEPATSIVTCPEEAEFGLADYAHNGGDISPWLGYVVRERSVLLMLVTAEHSLALEDRNELNHHVTEIDAHAILSRL